jgi:hypothetical protein
LALLMRVLFCTTDAVGVVWCRYAAKELREDEEFVLKAAKAAPPLLLN